MNPSSGPKRFLPLRQISTETNALDKSILHGKGFFDPRTCELTEAMQRLARQSAAPGGDARETPLQQFGVLVGSLRMHAGMAPAELAQAAGMTKEDVYAIELGGADLKVVSRALPGLQQALGEEKLSAWLAELILGE
jgi:DNA-binding XRE family transcriptional regulator